MMFICLLCNYVAGCSSSTQLVLPRKEASIVAFIIYEDYLRVRASGSLRVPTRINLWKEKELVERKSCHVLRCGIVFLDGKRNESKGVSKSSQLRTCARNSIGFQKCRHFLICWNLLNLPQRLGNGRPGNSACINCNMSHRQLQLLLISAPLGITL